VVTRWLLFGIGFDILARVVASLTRKWKRWMAISCTHGHLADPSARPRQCLSSVEPTPRRTFFTLGTLSIWPLSGRGKTRSDDPDHAESMADDLLAGCRSSGSLSRPRLTSEITKTVFANSPIAAARW
jgi:hypothetical protein